MPTKENERWKSLASIYKSVIVYEGREEEEEMRIFYHKERRERERERE